jgi:hypothetical protein
VITDMNANGRGIRFSGVDGGEERPYGPPGVGSRARISFRYSTSDRLPKMELLVNGVSYSLINFAGTGGNTFFADAAFTARALKPGPTNTIELRIQTGVTGDNNSLGANDVGGKINLSYIEVALLDDSDPPAGDISIDGRVAIKPASVPKPGDPAYSPRFSVSAAEDIGVTLVAARYDALGRLDKIDSRSAELKAGEKAVLQASVPCGDGRKYKFFIWDSGFAPLAAVSDVGDLESGL